MPYASQADMVTRFGQAEMIRLSAPGDELPSSPDAAKIGVALADATGIIDAALRNRYAVPLAVVPPEITRACCVLARYDLARGQDKQPSKEMIAERKEAMDWLASLASGAALLDAPAGGAAAAAMAEQRQVQPFERGGECPLDGWQA